VVHGADDRSFPPAMAEFTRDHIPGAEAAILYGAGHSLHSENADTFNSIVVGWLAKHR
jgi:pimeloyl-ACP methyl ester carboxylesterase